MAGDEGHALLERESCLGLKHANDGKRHRHQGGLGVLGQGELILRPDPDQGRQGLAERLVDLGEHGTRRRISLGELSAHADCLAPLPGKNESNAHLKERIPAAKVGPKTLFASSLSSWPRPRNAVPSALAKKENSVLQLLPPKLCFNGRIPPEA